MVEAARACFVPFSVVVPIFMATRVVVGSTFLCKQGIVVTTSVGLTLLTLLASAMECDVLRISERALQDLVAANARGVKLDGYVEVAAQQ